MVNKAYRTISHDANHVIAGVIPIDLMILEKCKINKDICDGTNRDVAKNNRRLVTLQLWQARWDDSNTGRETYRYFPKIVDRLKIKSDWNHYATQFLSGHGNFHAKLHGFSLKNEPWCDTCGLGVEDTAWHALTECPNFDVERAELAELWTEAEPGPRRSICVRAENFEAFCRTALRIGRKKERRTEYTE